MLICLLASGLDDVPTTSAGGAAAKAGGSAGSQGASAAVLDKLAVHVGDEGKAFATNTCLVLAFKSFLANEGRNYILRKWSAISCTRFVGLTGLSAVCRDELASVDLTATASQYPLPSATGQTFSGASLTATLATVAAGAAATPSAAGTDASKPESKKDAHAHAHAQPHPHVHPHPHPHTTLETKADPANSKELLEALRLAAQLQGEWLRLMWNLSELSKSHRPNAGPVNKVCPS